ncbi:MAG: cytochrome ubiquinol oxidase subunit I, partial [Pleurocapsa sp.]
TWLLSAPLGYIAIECGWIVRCVGRQPWVVYGEVRTVDAASNLPPADVLTSLTGFAITYTILAIAVIYFGSRIIREGPNLNLLAPGEKRENEDKFDTTPAEFVPNSRPVEAQQ